LPLLLRNSGGHRASGFHDPDRLVSLIVGLYWMLGALALAAHVLRQVFVPEVRSSRHLVWSG